MKTQKHALNFKTQRGVYAVEFAIVGGIFFLLLFAVLEIGRLFFVWNVLTEASRRGARLAAVCHFDLAAEPSFLDLAVFNGLSLAPQLTGQNLKVSYLRQNGSEVTASDNVNDIRLVRAEIINYQHQFLIPGLFLTINSPSFASTLPRESLGVTRETTTTC